MVTPRTPDRPPDLAERRAVERLLAELPEAGAIPRKEGELSFESPWQVRALGMAVELNQSGRFQWSDFQSRLVDAIREWEVEPAEDRGEWSYYRHWMRALERLAEEQGLVASEELAGRTQEFLTGTRDPRHR